MEQRTRKRPPVNPQMPKRAVLFLNNTENIRNNKILITLLKNKSQETLRSNQTLRFITMRRPAKQYFTF